jgi:hypothetical protein
VVAEGATRELMNQSSALPAVFVATSKPLDAAMLAGELGSVEGLLCDGSTVRFRTRDVNGTLAALLAVAAREGADITELHVQKASLEDVFIELTSGAAAEHA